MSLVFTPPVGARTARHVSPLACAAEGNQFLERLLGGARAMRKQPPPPPPPPPPPKSRYVPPEEWVDEVTDAAIAWEKRVQFDAARGGNRMKQSEILEKAIGLE
mmetsp:Transcript_505/g.1280  ORF Transcript_505/g.1280 Transcript_505/m.1280 type:complete len:104 (+) Transcript_505:2-313(+)